MKRKRNRRYTKTLLSLLLALLLALQGTGPIFVQAKESIEEMPRSVDFSRPEPLTEAEAGIEETEAAEETEEVQKPSQEESKTNPENAPPSETGADESAESEQPGTSDQQSETAEVQENDEKADETEANESTETSQPEEAEAKEVELKEPEDYYPLPEEPEGELVDYDLESRTYKTGDKQYTTVFGGYVGTYEDEDGKVQLTDNTLVESEPKAKTRARSAEPASTVYENEANDYTIQLPSSITENAGIKIQQNDYEIELIPAGGDYSHSTVKENAILYNQVYDGIDVQYTVLDDSVKEDIILRKQTEQTSFAYELNIPGLKAELKDNQVYLYPEEKGIEDAEYILEAPSMEDAAGAVSFHITLNLEEKDGKQILTVLPDTEWLQSGEREYPVRIDPSTISIDRSQFSLIGVEQGSPNTTVGDNNYPYVGYDDGIKSGNLADYGTAHMICRTFVKVNADFSVIPKDSKIDSATFSVSQRTNFSNGASQFGLYRVNEPWSIDITWKTQPYDHTFIDVQNAKKQRNEYIDYDVKDLINDWVQGTYANNGMVLKAIEEAAGLEAAMQCEVLNNKNSVYGPKITVQWSPAEDPYLRDMSLDETTINLRPMTEASVNGKLKFDAVFPDGVAKSKSVVEYYLIPDEEAVEKHHVTDAKPLYSYPDSTEYNKEFPEANKYLSKDSNWQGALYSGLSKDKLYQFKAVAAKEIDGKVQIGKEVSSDTFVIYEVKQYDTFPKIAKYYGIPLATIMKDNQVIDALVVANNTIFIRNPKTNVPYNPAPLTDIDKMRIDGALMGRGLHCEFGFEPVNLNTGNFYMDQSDASLNDLGGEFSITRSYNSKATDRNSMFGRGWSFNYDQALSMLEDGTILYMRGDGSTLFFEKNEDGSYSAPNGYEYDLKAVSYEDTDYDYIGWEIKDAEQSIWSFDKYGMLRFVTDVDGFKTVLDYDDDYNLESITTPSGKKFQIKQDDQGYVTEITLPDGGKLSYEYDESGNLTGYVDAAGGTYSYNYDDQYRMISWQDANENTVVTNEYDEEGRVIKQTDANGNTSTMEYSDGQTVTTDNEGNVTTYKYDDQYRTTEIIYPDGTTCQKTYNSENQLESETTANGTKSYTYDEFGNIATETREDGATASYVYNSQNKLVSFTNYNDAVTTNEYDGSGNLIEMNNPDGSSITYTYDDLHRMVSMTDGRGIKTTYAYDGANLTTYVDGEGNTWSFAYDSMNRMTSRTDPLGNVESIGYNANGDVTSETAADGGVTKYKLDKIGNIKSITDPLGNVTKFTYDAMYNMTKGEDPEGNTVTYEYNKNYQEVLATNAAGATISYEYDSMGRVVKETNEDFGTKLYEYDAAGNLVKYTDGEDGATVSEFNKLGLVTKTTDAVGNVTQYSYDSLGNETQSIHADGGKYTTTYDSMGRVSSETDELGAVVTYTYDANGNIISMSDDSGRTYTYEYDRNNNKIKETNPEGGVCTYTYDKAGRQTSYTNEEGQTETYTYDSAGRVTSTENALKEVYTVIPHFIYIQIMLYSVELKAA